MVTKKKPFLSPDQKQVLDFLAEAPRRWRDLKKTTTFNPKTLKHDVLNVLERERLIKNLGKRSGYAITQKGLNQLQILKAQAYIRDEIQGFLMQVPSELDSLILVSMPSTGKRFIIYSPDKEVEGKLVKLFGVPSFSGELSLQEQQKVEVFKQSIQKFMRSYINSGGSKDYLESMYTAFSKWLP